MSKIYGKFKAKNVNNGRGLWSVVTDDEEEIVIAIIPSHVKHPKGIAQALSSALTNAKFVLTDLV